VSEAMAIIYLQFEANDRRFIAVRIQYWSISRIEKTSASFICVKRMIVTKRNRHCCPASRGGSAMTYQEFICYIGLLRRQEGRLQLMLRPAQKKSHTNVKRVQLSNRVAALAQHSKKFRGICPKTI